MTAFNESQTNGGQTIELVVEADQTEEVVQVTINKSKGQEEMTVQVIADSKDESKLHKHTEKAPNE
ncbi:hypothetical protein OAW17_04880, partial [Flavobacteriaceae bacterium]|nr:hypothetical protein [Flavobacteriaceae bacterium]